MSQTLAVRPGMIDLGAPGPLSHILIALQAQLQAVFPPQKFDLHILTGPTTRKVMDRITQRLPALGLGWAAVKPDPKDMRVFTGASRWTLLIITSNENSAASRLLGDAMAPGLLSLVQAATVALHGLRVTNPPGLPPQSAPIPAPGTTPPAPPWYAEGSAQVTGVELASAEGYEDQAIAMAQIGIEVPYAARYAPGSGWAANELATISTTWGFAPPEPGTVARSTVQPDGFDDTWNAPGWEKGTSA